MPEPPSQHPSLLHPTSTNFSPGNGYGKTCHGASCLTKLHGNIARTRSGPQKAFKWLAAFGWSFEVFVPVLFTAEMPQVSLPFVGGGHVHVRRIWSRGMCFHCYVPLGQGFSSLFWEDEIGNWQVARDLSHSEVNQLVIGMDCLWHSTISILIFSDIRWYAMLPNDVFYYNIPNLQDLVLDAVSTSWHGNAARTQHLRQYSSITSFSDSKSRGKWPRRIKAKSLLGLGHIIIHWVLIVWRVAW